MYNRIYLIMELFDQLCSYEQARKLAALGVVHKKAWSLSIKKL